MTRADIISACKEILSYEHLKPRNGKTYCNFGIDAICRKLDIKSFWNEKANRLMLANEMFAALIKSDKWEEVNFSDTIYSQGLYILATRGKVHGHIAVVFPAGTSVSWKWRCHCPMVLNIGKENDIMGANYAFKNKPRAFKYG